MPKQASLRLIRPCRVYERCGAWKAIPHLTRGVYVLYRARPRRKGSKRIFVYLGA